MVAIAALLAAALFLLRDRSAPAPSPPSGGEPGISATTTPDPPPAPATTPTGPPAPASDAADAAHATPAPAGDPVLVV
ncbi:MAG TPA: hypothetical protein VFS92_10245, partial [Planctomycetota bacterium]|nr:hypothetical protein [Planctomycetota bacterium]